MPFEADFRRRRWRQNLFFAVAAGSNSDYASFSVAGFNSRECIISSLFQDLMLCRIVGAMKLKPEKRRPTPATKVADEARMLVVMAKLPIPDNGELNLHEISTSIFFLYFL
ncbi:hypothetical protein PIB30_066164 [Stylosanthes scabra]|uniref:Uncharacterized protein n=1 Tax=Stylosanthes scabra TaxID=79078 RepID=A0ABU6WNX0_9FABA|nr:hypothetical protein [Stylosanthes scabra]